MSTSEAAVETFSSHGVTAVFGVMGGSFISILDLMETAGIRFVGCRHEQTAVS